MLTIHQPIEAAEESGKILRFVCSDGSSLDSKLDSKSPLRLQAIDSKERE
jgi:hypothetical protein